MVILHCYKATRVFSLQRIYFSRIRCLHHLLACPPPRIEQTALKRAACSRGKKTKASIKLDDLPQGLIPLEPLALEQNALPPYPTVILQARTNMRKFENCVLLTRVGGFYELYFEHAEQFGPLLNLKVADKQTIAGIVPMSGFPFFQLDRYLKILVQDLNRYVAIAEEFPNDAPGKVKAGGLMHDRKVSRIITPGTLIDENFMDPFVNNYVLAIHTEAYHDLEESVQGYSSMQVGLAWLDLSTGQFFTQSTTLSAIPSFIARIAPREIILDEDLQAFKDHCIFAALAEEHHLITYAHAPDIKPISEWAVMLESPVPTRLAEDFSPEEVVAGSALLQYVEARLQGSNMKLQPPSRQLDVMGIDKNTMRALEIKKTMRDDLVTGSLLHTVRRTVTKGGARLLDSWLSSPSTSIEVINSRLDMIEYMLNNESLRDRIVTLLRRCHDCHRLLQKFAFGRGEPDDLLGLASTIYATRDLLAALIQDVDGEPADFLQAMTARIKLNGPLELADRILETIDEEGLVQQQQLEDVSAQEMQALANSVVESSGSKEDTAVLSKSAKKKRPTSIREYYSDNLDAWIMKSAASPTLEQLHSDLASLFKEKQILGRDLCARFRATSLTLKFTPGLGHICHIKGKDTSLDLSSVRSVSSSKSTRSFHHPDWTSLGQRIDTCKLHIRSEETRVFQHLREALIQNIIKLRRNASVLDELDISCSFASLAYEKNWTRPTLNKSSTHKVVGGRHPTVECGLEGEGRSFIKNDLFLSPSQRSWLITGPNMAGKSTFLRQNALITVLAQVGSYVPAEYAELGIVDQMFSRVGSADNLYRDQSTFMVEMLETSQILEYSTPRSFVIMDEIGRGTTPEDGIAVAFASLHHLYHVNKCRVIFATHFHSLADMVQREGMQGVGFYCTDVQEDVDGSGSFRYIHQLREGVNRESHALKVAKLAGMPEEALVIARRVLEQRKDKEVRQ